MSPCSHCPLQVFPKPILICSRSQVSLSVSISKRLTSSLPPFFSLENQSPERSTAETGQDLRHCALMYRIPAGGAPGTKAGSSRAHPAPPSSRLASKAIYLPLEGPEAREQTSGFCRNSPTHPPHILRGWELGPVHTCARAHTPTNT